MLFERDKRFAKLLLGVSHHMANCQSAQAEYHCDPPEYIFSVWGGGEMGIGGTQRCEKYSHLPFLGQIGPESIFNKSIM